MKYSGKALAKSFGQEMRATGLGLFGLEGISNKHVYAARTVLDEATFLELVYYSVIARMACGAMSVNDIQFLDAARANGDTEHRFMWRGAPAEVQRLRHWRALGANSSDGTHSAFAGLQNTVRLFNQSLAEQPLFPHNPDTLNTRRTT